MKKIIAVLMIMTVIFSLVACGGGSAEETTVPEAKTTTATGDVVIAELPEGWTLNPGSESCGDSNFDFIEAPEGTGLGNNNFSILRSTTELEEYREKVESGNYGKFLGAVELGEGTWYIAEKLAAGPIGEDSCVIQGYDIDLNSEEAHAIFASLKWAK